MGALPNYLTPREIADLLQISYDNALGFIKYSGVKYVRLGRQYRVEERDLINFLAQNDNIVVDLQTPIQ